MGPTMEENSPKNRCLGSMLDDLLRQDDALELIEARVWKRVVARANRGRRKTIAARRARRRRSG